MRFGADDFGLGVVAVRRSTANVQESDRAIAKRATRLNAKNDPELAAALREYEAHLKKSERRRQARKKRKENPSTAKAATSRRKEKPDSPQAKRTSARTARSQKRFKR